MMPKLTAYNTLEVAVTYPCHLMLALAVEAVSFGIMQPPTEVASGC